MKKTAWLCMLSTFLFSAVAFSQQSGMPALYDNINYERSLHKVVPGMHNKDTRHALISNENKFTGTRYPQEVPPMLIYNDQNALSKGHRCSQPFTSNGVIFRKASYDYGIFLLHTPQETKRY